MNRLIFTACLMNIISLPRCKERSQPNIFLFNSNWQFTRLNEVNLNNAELKKQGAEWSSQYDVTQISSKSDLDISKEIIQAEFNQLKTAK